MRYGLVFFFAFVSQFAQASDYCFICAPPVQKVENKVEVITRLVGFSQPQKSQLSLEEQFEFQRQLDQTLEPFLSQGQEPIPMRRFAFQKNTQDYVPKQRAVAQQQVQYQQTTQVYTGLVEVPVTIQNGKVTISRATVNGQPVSDYSPTVQTNVQSVSSGSVNTINLAPQVVVPGTTFIRP